MRERGPHAHDDDRRDKDERHGRRQRLESVLQFAFGLHDEPGAAEQGIGHDEAEAREETEWTEPIKTAAVVGSSRHLEAVDEGAQRDALREGRDVGAPGEGLVPERPVRFVSLEAEFESDAAPDQARQHEEDWDVERAQQHGISEREDSHQRSSSRTSQVSLPSQTGATVFTRVSRSPRSRMNGKRMPIPRSKPSITTYIISPRPMITAQMTGRSMPIAIISFCRLATQSPDRSGRGRRTKDSPA